MIDIQNIDGYGIEDPGFALLREVAHRYCPEELQQERKTVIPDEALNVEALASLYQSFLSADFASPATEASNLPSRTGGVGGVYYLC